MDGFDRSLPLKSGFRVLMIAGLAVYHWASGTKVDKTRLAETQGLCH
jgi:hypothetical protein